MTRHLAACLCFLLALPALATAESATTSAPAPATAKPVSTAAAPATTDEDGAPPADDDEVPAGPTVYTYLVARIKLIGTDLTQVAFLRHNAITDLDECEAERNAGLTTGWNYFGRYYLKTLKGVSYKVDYRCVQGELHMAYWRKNVPQDHYYLVHTADATLKVDSYRNYFDCRDALRRITREESLDAFCAISSQAVIVDPAPAVPVANPAPAAPAP